MLVVTFIILGFIIGSVIGWKRASNYTEAERQRQHEKTMAFLSGAALAAFDVAEKTYRNGK